jgi:hypothetical protein
MEQHAKRYPRRCNYTMNLIFWKYLQGHLLQDFSTQTGRCPTKISWSNTLRGIPVGATTLWTWYFESTYRDIFCRIFSTQTGRCPTILAASGHCFMQKIIALLLKHWVFSKKWSLRFFFTFCIYQKFIYKKRCKR